MSYYDYGYGFYKPTKPKEVKDGIKLQSGKIGSTWWSKKWISALESFTDSSRLERGRRYARKGQVMNFNVNSDGSVSAKVQGSASRPYSISIKIKTFSDNEWANIFKELSNQALFLARLLNGEMPEDIDEAFSRAGVSLFPNSRNQISTNCSCPDSANPCKHIAAVHYVLGEEFDRDPFMLFKLRGRSEEQVTSELRRLRSFDSKAGEEVSSQEAEEEYEVTSLNEGLSDFWFLGDEFNKISVSVTPPTVPLAIIKRLGAPGFWQDEDFEAVMEKIYGIMSDLAIKEAYSAVSEGMRRAGEKTSACDVNLNNIILHGTWVFGDGTPGWNGNKGKFFVWGEKIKAAATESGVKKKPGKRKKGEKAQAKPTEHPFCISAGELVEITKNLGFNFDSGECSQGSLIVSLPASGDAPRESFKRLIEATENASETLSEWNVPAVELSACEAAKQLMHLPFNDVSYNCGDISVNIKFGGDVLFWSCLAKFGFELIARQRFIPSITESTGVEEESKSKDKRVKKGKGVKEGDNGNDLKKLNLCAVWHPVYNYDEDSKRINLFVNSMPYVCAAAAKTGDAVLEKFSPAKLIINFLNTAIDETCRSWFKNRIARTGTWENKLSKDTVSSRWLSALCSPDGRVTGTTHQLNVLKSGVDKWSDAIKTSGSKMPFRTCFRLEEPCEESVDVYGDGHEKQEWSISFHLQSIADQSLLVPAEEIWKSKSVKYLGREFEHPQEMFLGDIAKAARLFPQVEESLKTKRPEKCTIGTEGAYMFLKEGAWLLEESGYGVLIPSWWNKKGAASDLKIKAKASSPKMKKSAGQSFFGLDGIVEFDWEAAIGGEILSGEELERLAKLKVPLVKIRGKWIEFKKDRIEDALKILSKFEKGELTLAEAIRINSGIENIGIPIELESSGWVKDVINFDAGNPDFVKIKTPESFNGKLRPYQEVGFSWLSFLKERGIGACLADDMGLGKTIQIISALLHDKEGELHAAPVLLIAPTSVIGNWHHELAKFAPSLKVMMHHGADRLNGKKLMERVKKHDVVVTTYALSVRDEKDLNKIQWDGVVLDEAQCIKNPYTKQAQSIKKIGKKSGYRVALTGTPIENRLSELWSIMEFLNAGYFGSFNEFREKFAVPIERYRNPDVSESLRKMVKPFILRRIKTDKSIIKDLPDKIEMKTYCTLTVEQTTLYKAVVDEMMEEIESSEGMQRKGLVLSALTKLKQICNHPALFLHDGSSLEARSGKLEQLKDMLDNVLAVNEKALIFTQYSEMGEMLKNHLEEAYGREIFFLHGGIVQKKRDKMVTYFQEDKNAPPIFILSVKAGGLGLNLTSANHVFHFDRWWNPAVENQATDRSFRIGQKKNVQAYKFITQGTLEEKIDEMIESKKDLSDRILSAGDSWLTELSNDKLRELFSLREEY